MKRYAIKSKSGFLSPLRVFGRGIATKSNEVFAVRLKAKPDFTYTLKSEAKHDVAAYRAFVKETFKHLTVDVAGDLADIAICKQRIAELRATKDDAFRVNIASWQSKLIDHKVDLKENRRALKRITMLKNQLGSVQIVEV